MHTTLTLNIDGLKEGQQVNVGFAMSMTSPDDIPADTEKPD